LRKETRKLYRLLDVGDIYEAEGWVNIPALAALGCHIYVIIGPRQVGKTFGVLKYLCETDSYHIFMRRTTDELDMICEDPDFNTYLALEKVGMHYDIQKNGKGWIIGEVDPEDEKRPIIRKCGVGISLSRISKIRGFSGFKYSDLVLDEFIPEEIVVVRKAEGDAFHNAIVTIEGNRYLEGERPLRVWMLANANDLFSPIMIGMGLTDIVEEMIRHGEESRLYPDDGLCVVLPGANEIVEKRLDDPLLRFLSGNSKFSDMAFKNKFSYSDARLVVPKSIKGWRPLCRITGFYVWTHGDKFYCTSSPHQKGKYYQDNMDDKVRCQLDHPELKILYNYGSITFSSAAILYQFRKYFDIKQ